ncbi:hypothetical protein FPZ12_000130 [Amycolatopsis acidicola]|uniref:PE-PGRS family protein n=1 Tax=Amycolatopsis acidicola TaxID=2596893 RepID=A0A5N0VPY1_9PSEU|nr:hypothetical protein [Amycolatopsis acidicola]KAA9166671.1 hypothetical protein FPZ12_000130 [Amycolatopsis acidicola]
MQTWAKRGIQTALVTGGLLMLGTGIASADENVNPDTPAGPVDLHASVPIDISKNALGTLGKQVNLPEVHKEISTKPVTDVVNKALAPVSNSGAAKAAAPVTKAANGAVSKAAAPASQAVSGAVSKAQAAAGKRTDQPKAAAPSIESTGDPFMGNKVVGNVAVPIQITGNAIGVLGDAAVDSDDTQTYEHNTDVDTSGASGGLAGNAVNLDWALPIQISGNAGAVGGSGKTSGSATQSAATTGETTTDGNNGALAGNVVAPQGATPLQVSGNAIGWFLGHAETDFNGSSDATSGGSILTDGSQGAGSGNVAGVPVALPAKVSNNAVTWGGDADSAGGSTADATAGGTRPGSIRETPTYIETHGDDAFLGGNVAQPQPAVPATVVGNAASFVGKSVAGSGFDRASTIIGSNATSGGFTSTAGRDAALSGNIADAPVAIPAEVFCDGAAAIGSSAAGGCENTVDATAGQGGTYTNGNGGVVSGNSASAQPAGTAEVFGSAASAAGLASGSATEDKNVTAGGYNGSQGNDSAGSGNVAQVPVAVPAEVLGVAGAAAGQSGGTASETKDVTAGGGGNTQDDNGAGSANLIAAPVSVPAQVFGIGAAAAGQAIGEACTDTTSTAGDDLNANGKKGFLAGNLGDVPVSLPTQVHGIGGALGGIGRGASQNLTDSTAGGNATANGEGGSVAGNIVQAPTAGAATVDGLGAVLGGLASGESTNDVASTAGGDAETNGDGGSIAGDVVSAQLLPVAQVFGDAASLGGVADGESLNDTAVTSGGDITTSGVGGALAGDIFDAPVEAVAQVFGVAASLGGVAHAVADNTTTATDAGTDTTAGSTNSLSGVAKQIPVGALVQVYDIPAGLLATVTSDTVNDTEATVADHQPQFDLPVTLSELQAHKLPTFPSLKSLPLPTQQRADLPQVNTLPVQTPAASALPSLSGVLPTELPAAPASVQGLLPQADLPGVSSIDSNPTTLITHITDMVSGKGIHIQG